MAAPLFLPSRDALLARLRLTGASQPDSVAAIDSALRRVRLEFYGRLGSARVVEIVAYAVEDPATTDNGILRALAEETEGIWVRALLLRNLPVLFMDTAGQAEQVWNEEALTRNMGVADVRSEIEKLMEEVEANLARLLGGGEDASALNVSTIGPSETPPLPGDTIGVFCG